MKAAQRDLKRMFLLTTTIGGYDMPMRRAYIKSDWREIIPVDNTRAIMEIIVDTLEEATGYEILLERKDPEDASSIGQTSEEIILTTLQYDNDMEELNFMTTPYGDFFFTPMQKKRNFAYADGHPIILTDELKEVMCLRHCETVNSAEVSQVLFEVPDGLPYPPLRPEKYPAGSKWSNTLRLIGWPWTPGKRLNLLMVIMTMRSLPAPSLTMAVASPRLWSAIRTI